MKSITILVATLVLMTGCSSKESLPEISYIKYLSHQSAFSVERLHRIKIKDVESLESHLEQLVVFNVIEMFNLLKSTDLSEVEKQSIESQLILIAVMNEKFKIENWDKNEEMQNILENIIQEYPVKSKELSCLNWKEPMWVGEDECS